MPRFPIVVLALFGLAPAAAAQQFKQLPPDSAAAAVDSGVPLIFSISGGISLGTYQAGVNWALLQGFQESRRNDDFLAPRRIPPVRLAAVTGASAGNINTLFWAAEWCRRLDPAAPLPGPDSTMFWDLWVERADIRSLLPERVGDDAEVALLDRNALLGNVASMMDRNMSRPVAEPCGFPIGVSLTSVEPDTLRLPNADLTILTQRFAAVFRAHNARDASGEWKLHFAPLVVDSLTVAGRFGKTVDIARGQDPIPLQRVVEVVAASSSFPLAFQPVRIPNQPDGRLFMDGGVFDNNPVTLALALYEMEQLSGRRDARARRPVIIYVNPGRLRRDAGPLGAPVRVPDTMMIRGGLTPAARMMRGALTTARQYELQLLVRDAGFKLIQPSWALSDRYAPLVSEHLGAFAGFLAYPFREHDFFVGIYDGLVLLAKQFSCPRDDDGAWLADGDIADDCVAATVATMLATPALSIPPAGLPLLEALHADEFATGKESLEHLCTRTFDGISAEGAMALAVACALRARPAPEAPLTCDETDVAGQILCRDRFEPVLDALALRTDVLQRCARDCPVSAAAGAARLAAWISNPDSAGAELLDRVILRLLDVEYRAARGGESTQWERPLEFATMLYYGSSVRSGRLSDPSSLPPGLHRAWRIVPTAITAGIGEAGGELRWEWIAKEHLGLAAMAHYNPFPRADRAPYVTLGVALGPSIPLRWPDDAGLVFSRLGIAGELYFGEFVDYLEFDLDPFPAAHVFLDVLAGKLRLGYRYVGEPGMMYGIGHSGWLVGLSDVRGMFYWATRFARGPER